MEQELDVLREIVKRIKDIERRLDVLESSEYVTIIIKTTTGDPATGYTGQIVINTVDNTAKLRADGGWRTIASGW